MKNVGVELIRAHGMVGFRPVSEEGAAWVVANFVSPGRKVSGEGRWNVLWANEYHAGVLVARMARAGIVVAA